MDEVIESRQVYQEASDRVTHLDDAMTQLEADELICRKQIDELLASDDTVAYQMKSEQLIAIRSKQTHVRQSKGVAYRASLDALDDYNSDLRARTLKRKVELRATLQAELPLLLDALSIAASDVLVSIAFLDSQPACQLDLKRIITRHNEMFMNDINTRTRQLLADLEID